MSVQPSHPGVHSIDRRRQGDGDRSRENRRRTDHARYWRATAVGEIISRRCQELSTPKVRLLRRAHSSRPGNERERRPDVMHRKMCQAARDAPSLHQNPVLDEVPPGWDIGDNRTVQRFAVPDHERGAKERYLGRPASPSAARQGPFSSRSMGQPHASHKAE
jgi:hypothetical protein